MKSWSDGYLCDTSNNVSFESISDSDDKVKFISDGYLCETSSNVLFESISDSDDKVKSSSVGYLGEVSSQPTLESLNHTPDNQSKKCTKSTIKISKNPPPLDKDTWKKYDSEFSETNKVSWAKVRNGEMEAEKYVEELNKDLANFLLTKEEFKSEVKHYFKHKPPKSNHLEEMKDKKKELNKKAKQSDATPEQRSEANQAVRMYNYIKKIEKQKESVRQAKKEEKEYKKNFWKTAKNVANGTFGKEEQAPTFSKTTADTYYKNKYEKEVLIDPKNLKWFPKVDMPKVPYNLAPYKPKDIMKALSKKDKNSSPGDDGIVYEYLMKLPYIHKVLATAFTRIRDTGEAPNSWAKSNIILLKKDENDLDDDPTKFRMIALTLNIGKLYHTLEAQRTINFMVANKYLNPTAQKAYIEGVNGCVEHVTVVQEVIQDAKINNRTAHFTWFDLEDAFGSVPHMLIQIAADHYHIPTLITRYIMNLYKKLEGKVITANWESAIFKFLKGVFADDAYSGIIFLIVLNPIIEFIKQHQETHGYTLKTKTNVMNVSTTPFADGFNIISRELIKHQELVTSVGNNILWA